MMSVCSKNLNNEDHQGALGGFLKDENGVLFGLTCRHVTLSASDGNIYIMYGGSKLFGITLKRNDKYVLSKDIDVFKINVEYLKSCSNLCLNYQGQQCHVEGITSNFEDLYEKNVFMWRTKFDVDGRRSDERVDGCIAPFEVCNNGMFGNNILPFTSSNTREADSGRALLMQNKEKLYIVGLVLGRESGELTRLTIYGTSYCVCIKIKSGIELLSKAYGKSFRFSDILSQNTNTLDVVPGISLYVNTNTSIHKNPEDIAKLNFLLAPHIIMLLDCSFKKHEEPTTEKIVELENKMSMQVSNRLSVNLNESGSNEETFLWHCMHGSEHLYSEKYELCETQFKNAIHILHHTSCKHQLMAMLLTYITWLLLKTRQFEFLEELLSKGETFLFKFKADRHLPKYLGYFYFDYARFHKSKGNFPAAMEMAQKSLKYFLDGEREDGTIVSSKCFPLALMAKLHLSESDYEQARKRISDIEEMGPLPVVENTTYLLVKSDYHSRRHEQDEARKIADRAMEFARKNALKQEFRQAQELLKTIQMRIQFFKRKS